MDPSENFFGGSDAPTLTIASQLPIESAQSTLAHEGPMLSLERASSEATPAIGANTEATGPVQSSTTTLLAQLRANQSASSSTSAMPPPHPMQLGSNSAAQSLEGGHSQRGAPAPALAFSPLVPATPPEPLNQTLHSPAPRRGIRGRTD